MVIRGVQRVLQEDETKENMWLSTTLPACVYQSTILGQEICEAGGGILDIFASDIRAVFQNKERNAQLQLKLKVRGM